MSRDSDSATSLGSLFQCLTTLLENNFFLISNLNLPWHNLRPFPLVLSLLPGEVADPHLTMTSLQAVVEIDKVSPEPPLLQNKQSQFLQPLLMRLVLQIGRASCRERV